MKKIVNCLFTLLLLLAAISIAKAQVIYSRITNYQVYFGWARHYPQDYMILRRFESQGKPYLLMVNPITMQTYVNDAGFYQIKPMTIDDARKFFKSTPYQKALGKAQGQSINIQDAGIEHGMPKETGISLTADLCPSHRPLDKVIFTDIIRAFQQVEKPVPIALSVTGIWMNHHQRDLDWLKQMEARREIGITWINHSYNHRVGKNLPLKENFLLEPGTDINYEVLQTEKTMLGNGLLPSVFFRFPGLVSDQQLVDRIISFGLIPVGTDAWLAKGQQPQAGSIVLIHGNGNEPVGVADFINLLRSKATSIAKKQWLLYDLRESVDEEFSGNH